MARSLKKYFSILLYIRLNIGIYPVLFHSHKSLLQQYLWTNVIPTALSGEIQYISAICPVLIKNDMKYTLRVEPLKNELLKQFMTCQFPRFGFKWFIFCTKVETKTMELFSFTLKINYKVLGRTGWYFYQIDILLSLLFTL